MLKKQRVLTILRALMSIKFTNFCSVGLLTQYCAGGKIEKNEVGRACGTYGGGERCAQSSSGET